MTNTRNKPQKFGANWIGCDLCLDWFHSACQDLQNSDVNALGKLDKKNVKWFCSSCIPQVNKSLQGTDESGEQLSTLAISTNVNTKLKQIEAMVSKLMSSSETCNDGLAERMEKLERAHEEAAKRNADDVRKSLEINSSAKDMLQKNFEQQQAESRKRNAIVYGIAEDESKTALDLITEIMKKEFFMATKGPLRAARLHSQGPRHGNRPRPIKLEFADEHNKWEFLKRAKNLRTEDVFCKTDEPKEVRDRQYALRQQIKQMKQKHPNTEYRIRNCKIQSKEPNEGEWKVLNSVRQGQTRRNSSTV